MKRIANATGRPRNSTIDCNPPSSVVGGKKRIFAVKGAMHTFRRCRLYRGFTIQTYVVDCQDKESRLPLMLPTTAAQLGVQAIPGRLYRWFGNLDALRQVMSSIASQNEAIPSCPGVVLNVVYSSSVQLSVTRRWTLDLHQISGVPPWAASKGCGSRSLKMRRWAGMVPCTVVLK